jgi:serine/threonine protein kinase
MPKNPSLAGPALALRLEQARRWRQGDRAPAEEYLARHPELATDPEYALEVVFGELLLREEEGERPRAEEFQKRFPEFSAQLRRLFEVHTAVRSASPAGSASAATCPQDISATDTPIKFPGAATERGPLGQLGPYHVMEKLGQGGMGVVYKAYDERFARVVALKFLKSGLAAGERSRFEREARATGAVKDDHVVVVHDMGDDPDHDLRYIVMEYVEGETAADRLRRSPALPTREAADLVRQVALGLAAAHARGLVHRDVKPSNILLERSTGRAKIVDFGLARSLDAGDERLTLSGAIIGRRTT